MKYFASKEANFLVHESRNFVVQLLSTPRLLVWRGYSIRETRSLEQMIEAQVLLRSKVEAQKLVRYRIDIGAMAKRKVKQVGYNERLRLCMDCCIYWILTDFFSPSVRKLYLLYDVLFPLGNISDPKSSTSFFSKRQKAKNERAPSRSWRWAKPRKVR